MTPTVAMIPVSCRCGRQMQALLQQSASGRSRCTAECATCGRLLRRFLPPPPLKLKLRPEDLAALRVGSPFLWNSERRPVTPAADFAKAYRVEGMPSNMTANLMRDPAGRWTFLLHAQRQSVHSEWLCGTKEQAFEDLKNFLEGWCSL